MVCKVSCDTLVSMDNVTQIEPSSVISHTTFSDDYWKDRNVNVDESSSKMKEMQYQWLCRQLLCLMWPHFGHIEGIYTHCGRSLKTGLFQWFRASVISYEMTKAHCPCLASAWEHTYTSSHKQAHTRTSLQFTQHSSCCHGNLSPSPRGILYRTANINTNTHTTRTLRHTWGTPCSNLLGKNTLLGLWAILCQKVRFMPA